MTAPVSCIITSYNNGRTLGAAVASVLHQTLPVAEIVIADDGSTDGSRELIAQLARAHPCITPILRERNLGVAANRDLAIRAAAQPFVTHLDGDDLFVRDKIAAEWRVLAGRFDAVAYSLIARVWPGKWWRTRVLDPAETVGVPGQEFDRLIARAGAIPRDMLFAKKLFELAGGFNHRISFYEDWEFKIRLSRSAQAWLCSREIGTIYILHGDGLSSAYPGAHKKMINYIRSVYGQYSSMAASPSISLAGRVSRFTVFLANHRKINRALGLMS
jgi:glycosyltransferase involved in cell wall biosynthesis